LKTGAFYALPDCHKLSAVCRPYENWWLRLFSLAWQALIICAAMLWAFSRSTIHRVGGTAALLGISMLIAWLTWQMLPWVPFVSSSALVSAILLPWKVWVVLCSAGTAFGLIARMLRDGAIRDEAIRQAQLQQQASMPVDAVLKPIGNDLEWLLDVDCISLQDAG
ncbi:hypothetical protein GYB61_06510, partial [bacterium]|nr:hypothetical protein [bacterium]